MEKYSTNTVFKYYYKTDKYSTYYKYTAREMSSTPCIDFEDTIKRQNTKLGC